MVSQFTWGSTFGQKYEKINQLLIRLAVDLNVDLWTLDAVMWGVLPRVEQPRIAPRPTATATSPESAATLKQDIIILDEYYHLTKGDPR